LTIGKHKMNVVLVEENNTPIECQNMPETVALEIVECYGRYFDLEFPNPHHSEAYKLRSKGYVGLFPLKSGNYIRVLPKVSCPSIWAMLMYAHGTSSMRWLQGQIACETIEQVFAAFAKELVLRIEARCHSGLRWEYESREGIGSPIRGRIQGPDYHHPWHIRFRFAEGGPDSLDNQILLWTLYSIRSMPWLQGLKMDIERVFRHLRSEISLVAASVQALERRKYNRQQEDYRTMHLLCRFLLGGVAPGIHLGSLPSIPFALHMATIFEQSISSWLIHSLAGLWKIEKQWELAIEGSENLRFRIDMALFERERGTPLAVIDTKYKLDREPAAGDIQQVVAYAVRLGVRVAILVYPQTEIHSVSLQVGNVSVFSIGVDMGVGDWPQVGEGLNRRLIEILSHKYDYVNLERKHV